MICLERLKTILFCLLLAAFAAALICFPGESAEAARQGLRLCFQSVLPSLFPFFVLSSLFTASSAADALAHALSPVMRPLFGLSGAGASALALGLVGGYPVGARTAAELRRTGALSPAEAEHLLGFCNNAGPGFILGVCGGTVFASPRAGVYLCLVHAAAAMLTGIALRRIAPAASAVRDNRAASSKAPRSSRRSVGAFPAVVRDAFAAVWSVCGFVVLFAVLLRLITLLLPDGAAAQWWYPLLLGGVELTNGVAALPADRRGFVLCAVLLGWGGLSVHAQTLSVLEDTGLSARRYLLGKTLQAALSAPLALLAARWVF